MDKLLTVNVLLIILILFAVFLLGYGVKSILSKKRNLTILTGAEAKTEEEKIIRKFVNDVEDRLTSIEKNNMRLEEEVTENKKMRQLKEEHFLKSLRDLEAIVFTSLDKTGRIPELEELGKSIHEKLNATIYNKEGLEKTRKIIKLEEDISLVEMMKEEEIAKIKSEINNIRRSM